MALAVPATRTLWRSYAGAIAALSLLATPAVRADSFDDADPRCHALQSKGEARGPRADDDCRITLSFATVGDSREEAGATYLTPQDAIWLQNTKVWSRIIREVQALRPELLFFNGDMIMGYKDAAVAANHEQMNREYAFWRGMATQLLETGTYVVPVPGNHETQDKAAGKKSKVANEALWRDNMSDLILDAPRFTALVGTAPAHFDATNNPSSPGTSSLDHITTDQKELSFSFDVGAAHFAVINTDPVGYDAHAPVAWLDADLAAARKAGAKQYFIFGHKPAFSYFYPLASGALTTKTNGLDSVADLSGRDAFWQLVDDYGATYFCGHEHIYDVMQPTGRAWQVLVGSGGSPFEADAVQPIDRAHAYAVVKIFASGRVHATAYGFSEQLGPTVVLKDWDLN